MCSLVNCAISWGQKLYELIEKEKKFNIGGKYQGQKNAVKQWYLKVIWEFRICIHCSIT